MIPFAVMSTETWVWIWVILIVVALAMKKATNNLKRFYGGIGRAVYNSPLTSAAAKHGAAYFLHRLFR